MERKKELERERQVHHQSKQQLRGEAQDCDQAVQKHFEESLRNVQHKVCAARL